MNEKKPVGAFSYSYSAEQQNEIKHIREKYLPKEPDKLELLRRLDRSPGRKACALAIAIGVVGTLTMGIGMCCCMVWSSRLFLPGIVIGLAGIFLLAMAYPVYLRILKKERQRLAPEILRLSEELLE